MLTKNVVKGIHQITDAYTNWFLVEEDDRLTVVDCGVRSSWATLHRILDELGYSSSSVEAIVLTHAHFDHIGFAEKARVELGVPVLCHEDEVHLTKHPLQYGHERSRLHYLFAPNALPIAAAFIRGGGWWPHPIGEVQTFGDDGVLDVPGSPRIVYTPGHTLGHTAFLFEDRDALIAGDALVMLNPFSGRTGPRMVSLAATTDSDRARASLDVIGATGVTTLLTGHGEPWRGGAEEAAAQAKQNGHA
jgi:glyoxylase-like metal-dependent hydrolase (beta-lactamase superfamily II)